MKKDYRFQYVPSYIIRNWKDGEGNIPYITRGENEVFTSPLEDTFIEHLDVVVDAEKLEGADATANPRLVDIISELTHGDFSSVDKGIYWFSALVNHVFYVNPFSRARIEDIALTHAEEIMKSSSPETLSDILTKYFSGKRTTEDLFRMREKASTAFVYGFDLESAVLEAPQDVDFVLGSDPAFFFNPTDKEKFKEAEPEITGNGIAVILPLSPRYALFVYDSSAYKVRKRDGRIVLSEEDTLELNKIMAGLGTSFVFSPTEKYGDEYYAHFYDDIGEKLNDYVDAEFSFIRILADVYSRDTPEREFAQRMFFYDSTHFNYENVTTVSEKEYQERIRYALSIASEIKG